MRKSLEGIRFGFGEEEVKVKQKFHSLAAALAKTYRDFGYLSRVLRIRKAP